MTLGGGSVSTVRAGVLVEARNNEALETPHAATSSIAKGDQLQPRGDRPPPFDERVVALKLFKTSQVMHSRSHLSASINYSLYPEVCFGSHLANDAKMMLVEEEIIVMFYCIIS